MRAYRVCDISQKFTAEAERYQGEWTNTIRVEALGAFYVLLGVYALALFS